MAFTGDISCEVNGGSAKSLMQIVTRVRRMFDVDAIPGEIQSVLSADRKLGKIVRQNPGQRIPGAFDEFEIAVRAIVGQQVSVKGATTVMANIASRYGDPGPNGPVFPGAVALSKLKPETLPMPGKRALAIKTLAEYVADGRLVLSGVRDADECQHELMEIPGIGPWTAQYIAMRALNDPDAFLHGDLVIKKVAKHVLGIDTEAELIERAESWRPWRGYAGMHLWRTAATLT